MMKSRPASMKEYLGSNCTPPDHKNRYHVNKTDYYTFDRTIVTYHYNSHFSHPLTLNELARWIQSVPLEERDCEVWSFQGLDANGDANFFAPSLERAWENEEGDVMQFEVTQPDTDDPKIVYVL